MGSRVRGLQEWDVIKRSVQNSLLAQTFPSHIPLNAAKPHSACKDGGGGQPDNQGEVSKNMCYMSVGFQAINVPLWTYTGYFASVSLRRGRRGHAELRKWG